VICQMSQAAFDHARICSECQMALMVLTLLLYAAYDQRIISSALVACAGAMQVFGFKDTAHEDNLSSE
jgi:hypothetical protein